MDRHAVFIEKLNHLNLTVCLMVGQSLKDLIVTADGQNISLLLINFEGIVSHQFEFTDLTRCNCSTNVVLKFISVWGFLNIH
jgi:hypothetical protein